MKAAKGDASLSMGEADECEKCVALSRSTTVTASVVFPVFP